MKKPVLISLFASTLAACQGDGLTDISSTANHSSVGHAISSSSVASQPSMNSSSSEADIASSSQVSHNQLDDQAWVFKASRDALGVGTHSIYLSSIEFNFDHDYLKLYAEGCDEVMVGFELLDNITDKEGVTGINIYEPSALNDSCANRELGELIARLGRVLHFYEENASLIMVLDDGSSLLFSKRFDGCDNPISVTGAAVESSGELGRKNVILTFADDQPIDDLVNALEEDYADLIVRAVEQCSDSLPVQVHDDTLARLQCDARITAISQ